MVYDLVSFCYRADDGMGPDGPRSPTSEISEMKIGLLQLNLTVGDFDGNAARIVAGVQRAADAGAELCVTSELALWGYPARDLLLNPGLVRMAWEALERLAEALRELPPTLVGIAEPNPNPSGKRLYNAVALLRDGKVAETYRKTLLPTYDVFDEARYFEAAPGAHLLELGNTRVGVTICEDIWNDKDFESDERYRVDPLEALSLEGIDVLVNLSGSPFTVGKQEQRMAMLTSLSGKYGIPVVYVNQVGGNDDLVFDGRSMAVDAHGQCLKAARAFEEDVVVVDTESDQGTIPEKLAPEAEVWAALRLGVRDYLAKTGFERAVIGLSGGIDSALTAAVAADAIGPENVLGVLMPSPYSSEGSITDAIALGEKLGIETLTLPIEPLMTSFDGVLGEVFAGREPDTTEENLQSRARGNLLMALSNKFRAILLTTGNKSELSVGYCTIYGDMSGGLAVIADLPKTLVYDVCRWVNAERGETIPQNTIDKPPSAELRPDQRDTDSLPDYDVLDDLLERYVERHHTKAELLEAGFELAVVERVTRLVKNAEFKRKQAAPGIKITDRAFGTGWRMPIAWKNPEQ